MAKKKLKHFTKRELRDLLISVLVLGFFFAFALEVEVDNALTSFITNWLWASLIVGVAFVGHELAHKFVAIRYDLKSEYVLWPQGILISAIVFFLSGGRFIFAALGFVSISNLYSVRLGFKYVQLTLEESGIISASGPAANLVIALISGVIAPFIPQAWISVNLNLILAVFNLLPVPPLDGSKVFVWSRIAWVTLIGVSISLFFLLPLAGWLVSLLIAVVLIIALIFYAYSINL